MLSSALPSRSWPAGASAAAAAARVSARAAEASEPSSVARASTATSTKSSTSSARTANATRLGGVEQRQGDANGQRLDASDERGAEQGGGEVHAAEQRRGRHRAAGLVEDEDRERDLPEPVAELVDQVGEAAGWENPGGAGGGARRPSRPKLLQRFQIRCKIDAHECKFRSRVCKFVQVL